MSATIHENVVWHFPGTTWMARGIEGRETLLSFLKELMVRTSDTFTLEDVAVHGSDHHVIAIQRLGATHGGEHRAFDVSSVMRFESGRQIERWFYLHDPEPSTRSSRVSANEAQGDVNAASRIARSGQPTASISAARRPAPIQRGVMATCPVPASGACARDALG